MTYMICKRCVMDSTDPLISFDSDGVCSYCNKFENVQKEIWFPNNIGQEKLETLIADLKVRGKGKEYDAILGLSGGIDSSYLALKSKEWGLRLLVMHVDAGWNSEVSVSNIERLVNYCGYELFTHVIDWNEIRDLQLAYLKSGVSNQDVPQDHAFFAALYGFAVKHDISTILSGGNIATEGIAPNWMFDPLDATNLKAIHKKHGTNELKSFPRVSFLQRYLLYPIFYRLRVVRPLNYMPYDRKRAREELQAVVGWKDYGRKHGESHFTKFYQNYYLPKRYGYDKRRPHLSSLIVAGQMSRDEALGKLEEPLYLPEELEKDIDFVCNKLQITRDELNQLVELPAKDHLAYSNQLYLHRLVKKAQNIAEKILGKKIKVY